MIRQKKINEKLISARLAKHWTQEQACELVGVPNVRTWQRWETEGTTPSPYFRLRLCEVFDKSPEDLGLFPRNGSTEQSERDTGEITPVIDLLTKLQVAVYAEDDYPLFHQRGASTSLGLTSNDRLLKSMIERNFSKEITDDLLSSNIRTMNFRNEWQYVVNNLVSEAKMCLRAMVFDVELTRWWNTVAGQIYMMTNMALLKRKVPVKRIFILSSLDARLRANTLITAYVHHKMGINVKICKVAAFQDSIPFNPDMFSVHDNLFVTLYYFSLEKPIANLLLEDKYILEFTSFYDELFMNDRLCISIDSFLAHSNPGESFFASVKMQLEMLRALDKVGSVTELVRNLQQ